MSVTISRTIGENIRVLKSLNYYDAGQLVFQHPLSVQIQVRIYEKDLNNLFFIARVLRCKLYPYSPDNMGS